MLGFENGAESHAKAPRANKYTLNKEKAENGANSSAQGQNKGKKATEFSKKILNETKLLFLSQLVLGCIAALSGYDTTFFIYSIPATAGVYGAAIVFYLNKAKIENIWKGKIGFLKLKMRLSAELPPEQWERIESELSTFEIAFDAKIDSVIQESVNSDVDIQNY